MSVLVIGGTGFIGPRVIRKLVERGEEVVCMDINPWAASFEHLSDQVRVVRGDITHFDDVIRTVLEFRPERLINLAYIVGGGEGDPHNQMRLNVLGMDNCFESARLCGVKRVVYASSIAVYGPQHHYGERPVNEDDPKHGTRQYSMHKIFNEFQAEQYIKNYGMSITGIRPAHVTGPDKVRGSTDHVQAITLPARGLPVNFPWQSYTRCPIHVEDASEIFVRVAMADSPRYNLYNSGGTPITLGALADLVRDFIPDAQITFDNEGGIEESDIYLVDNSRIREEFEVELPPFRQRVLDIINEVRQSEGMPLVRE